MSIEKLKLIDIPEPEYGLKYTHLTYQDMVYITQHNGCHTKTRYEKIKSLISRNKDLKKFEEYICDVSKLNSVDHSPYSYILNLALYGRINISFKVMRKILPYNLNEVCYEGSPFIDSEFIERFKNKGKDLKYNAEVVQRGIVEIVAILLFFNGTSNEIPHIFDEYIKLSNQNDNKTNVNAPVLYTILTNMGYELNNYEVKVNPNKKRQFIAPNMSQEFIEGLNKYMIWYSGKVSEKTAKCVRSNLMVFLNYIAGNFRFITKLNQITNEHIVGFKKHQLKNKNSTGKINSVSTINNRMEAVCNLWKYFIDENEYGISTNIVTIYDKLKEPKKYTKYIKKEDYTKLIKALKNVQSGEYFRLKIIIVILLSTGRRIHEVLSLRYDCLNLINGKPNIYFHKLKHDKPPINIPISDKCKFFVLKAKELVKNYSIPLTSVYDNLNTRRLFVSIAHKGRGVLSLTAITRVFYKFQIENRIINEEGRPIFKIHDIKRTFVSNMLALGYSSVEVSKFLGQQISSLIPYEANNQKAMNILKLAEKKELLIGCSFVKEPISGGEDTKLKSKIINLLKNTDVINRHKENLIYKVKNPGEVIPLALGECTDVSSTSECGSIICLACEEIFPDDINIIDAFILKMYKYIYANRRKKGIKDIEKQIVSVCHNIYINKEKMSEIEMKKHINLIKKKARKKLMLKEGVDDEKGI